MKCLHKMCQYKIHAASAEDSDFIQLAYKPATQGGNKLPVALQLHKQLQILQNLFSINEINKATTATVATQW